MEKVEKVIKKKRRPNRRGMLYKIHMLKGKEKDQIK